MASSVATPLERAFAAVPQVTSMTSTSAAGKAQIVLQFDLSRNIDGAAQDVQTAIYTATPDLPKTMTSTPTFNKVNPAEDTQQSAIIGDESTVIIDIHKQPGFNVLSTIQNIKAQLPTLTAWLPKDVNVQVVGDRPQTIGASVSDVQFTLLLSGALMVIVIFLFLRKPTATLIPALTLPLSKMQAAAEGLREVGFTIVSMTATSAASTGYASPWRWPWQPLSSPARCMCTSPRASLRSRTTA